MLYGIKTSKLAYKFGFQEPSSPCIAAKQEMWLVQIKSLRKSLIIFSKYSMLLSSRVVVDDILTGAQIFCVFTFKSPFLL